MHYVLLDQHSWGYMCIIIGCDGASCIEPTTCSIRPSKGLPFRKPGNQLLCTCDWWSCGMISHDLSSILFCLCGVSPSPGKQRRGCQSSTYRKPFFQLWKVRSVIWQVARKDYIILHVLSSIQRCSCLLLSLFTILILKFESALNTSHEHAIRCRSRHV